MSKRVILIVLDSAGVGFMPDSDEYNDHGANTLGHIDEAVGLSMPHLGKMGLGNILPLKGTPEVENPTGRYGKAAELSKGKDTTTGHWEIAGIIVEKAFPTYPNGFPDEIMKEFEKRIGRKTLGNKVASGTAIIEELGDEHVKTGFPIIYTSADSVFQIAAHEEIIPIEEQYEMNQIARDMLDKYMIGRVIARPFIGTSGNYTRTSNRHDYSLEPIAETILDKLKLAGKEVLGVGKINDIFAGKGLTDFIRTKSNMDGVEKTLQYMDECKNGLIFSNLVDFDMLFGHRRNPQGYKEALEAFDLRVPEILDKMKDEDILIITADHGCDPTFKGTDHTREYIPLIVYGKNIEPMDLGTRKSFADISATIDKYILGNDNGSSLV